MRKDYIECGKIVGTHGVRGEMRINPWCDTPKFLTGFRCFYLESTGSELLKVKSSRTANNIVLVKFENIDTVEAAEKYKNRIIYIKRSDANIGDRHFVQELKDCQVYDFDTKNFLGILTDVIDLPAGDVWQIKDKNKEYLFPAVDEAIKSVDIDNGKIIIKPMKGIFDDED